MTEEEKMRKRLAFLEDKCSTYIDRDIGMIRAINTINNERKKRLKEYMAWRREMDVIRKKLASEVAE